MLGHSGKNSSKTILNSLEVAKIKSRETPKQRNNNSQDEVQPKYLKIPDMNKTSFTGITDMARERKILVNQTQRLLTVSAGDYPVY